ncbi:MAG: hypothetical protein DIU78_009700 [Pseudomonadota bacterium]
MARDAWLVAVWSARGRAALARGIYAASVLGLLSNDHVFKGGAWLPGWVTGKLSDFFGLIVAPITLTVLFARLSARRAAGEGGNAWSRALGFALPVGVFVATELSQAAADGFAELVSMTGLSWRLWSDPTDLAALVVLPGAWVLAGWLLACEPWEPRVGLGRGPLLIGALACSASGYPKGHQARAYLVNRLYEPVEVDVAEHRGRFDCENAYVRLAPGLLRHEDFHNTERYVLERNQVLPLRGCGPVRVTVNGKAFGIQWSPAPIRRLGAFVSRDDLEEDRQLVLIEETKDGIGLRYGTFTEPLVLAEPLAPHPESECAMAHVPRLETTSLPSLTGRIVEKRVLSGGCIVLTVADAAADPGGGEPSTTDGAGGEPSVENGEPSSTDDTGAPSLDEGTGSGRSAEDGAGGEPSAEDDAGGAPPAAEGAGGNASVDDGADGEPSAGGAPSLDEGSGGGSSVEDGAGGAPSVGDGTGGEPSVEGGAGGEPSATGDAENEPSGANEPAGVSSVEQRTIVLCIPESEFPFVVGDVVRFSSNSVKKVDSNLSLGLRIGAAIWMWEHESLVDADCGPVRDPCGAVWQPLDFVVNGEVLPPGERHRVATVDYYLARAFRPIITVPSCGPGLTHSHSLPANNYFVELIYVHGRP